MKRIARIATTVLVAGGMALGSLGVSAGVAEATSGPYTWCPGDDLGGWGGGFNTPANARPNWDWNICHTYHYVNDGQGNVSATVWEGDNPPPPYPWQPPNVCWAMWIPRPCQPGVDF